MNRTEDMGNNETRSYGVFDMGDQGNQRYLAMTRWRSKWFKTERGAIKWMIRNAPNIAQELGLKVPK